jgi:hypothetical protein
MTNKTVVACLCFLMAPDAEPHLQLLLQNDPVHLGHIPVTITAVYLPVNVHRMIEIHEIRQYVDPVPEHGLVFEIKGPQFRDRRIRHRNPGMAKHAGLERRDPGPRCFHGFRMTEKTTDLLVVRMDPVAERDRLFDPDSGPGVKIKHVQKHAEENGHDGADGYLVPDAVFPFQTCHFIRPLHGPLLFQEGPAEA